MTEIPDSYHVLNINGTRFYVDHDVRREIESFLTASLADPQTEPFLIVDSLAGEEITVIAREVVTLYSTTPASRAFERAMDADLKREDDIG